MKFLYETFLKVVVLVSGDEKLKVFSLQRALMNVLGFNWWKGGINLPLPSVIKHQLYQGLSILFMIYSTTLTVKASIEMITENDFQYTLKMNGIILALPYFVSTLKMCYLTYMRSELIFLFETCENIGDHDIHNGPIGYGYKSCAIYFNLLLMNAGTWTAYFTLVYHEIPYKTDYPWSQENLTGWFSALGLDFFCGVHACLVHGLMDTIFPMAVSAVSGHLDKLYAKLGQLGKGRRQDGVIINESIELHNKLLRIRDIIRKCFDEVFIAQSVYTVMHACVLIFAAAKVRDKFGVMMSSFPLLMCSYAQLWMYCSYGQTMTDKFDHLTFASYNNSWYRCDIRTRKALVMFTESCKRAVTLKKFGNISASVSNFLQKCQDSVSFYLILKTITDGTGPKHS